SKGISLLSPATNQRFKFKPDQPVVFNWRSNRAYQRMKIKIGADPDFTKPIIDARVDTNQYSGYDLPRDTELFWQVIAEGGESDVSRFVVVGDRPPIPVFPKPGQHIYFNPYLEGPAANAAIQLN